MVIWLPPKKLLRIMTSRIVEVCAPNKSAIQ
jgi:hypothetical protein